MIRQAEEKDIPGILSCLSELSNVNYFRYADIVAAFKERESSGNIFTFVAEGEFQGYPAIVGTATLLITKKLSHGGRGVGYIDDVAVRKDCQSGGVGGELVKHCINYARILGCYKCHLDCLEKLIPYYQRFGFVTCGVEMRKNLI